MSLVIDASALIAYLEDEPGAEVVESILSSQPGSCFAHVINLCEVFYGVRREYGEQKAQETIAALRKAGLAFRDDIDAELWQEAARLKADWRRVSLADCFCAALSIKLGGEVITCDHHEFDALASGGACRVKFIR